MRTFPSLTVAGIRNGFNGFESVFDVTLVPTLEHNIVIVHETDKNTGPSITNCAEYACPAIAHQLGIIWDSALFIESYPPREHARAFDASYDLIRFKSPVVRRAIWGHAEEALYAPLDNPGWSPLPANVAQWLNDAGFMLSQNIGRVGSFRPGSQEDNGIVRARILSYNGRTYATEKGRFYAHHVLAIEGVVSDRDEAPVR